MKKPWVTLAAVLIVGLAAGAAIAGRPTTPAHDIRISAVQPTVSEASTTPAPVSTTAAFPSVTSTTAASAAPSTSVAATTAPATTIAATTTTTPVPDRSTVRLVVANAGKGSGIATAEAARLVALGYSTPATGDARRQLDQSTVYARAGQEAEARQLLADVGLPADRLQPFPSQSVTTVDAKADVILALGLDWQA